jgi:hypothetical protein
MPEKINKKNGYRVLVLVIILLIGGVARLWGISFGLPHTMCRPDEEILVRIAHSFGGGDLNPHYFIYPTLYMYLAFGLYIIYCLVGLVSGHFTSVSDMQAVYCLDPSILFIINRCLSAFMGIVTIYVVYRIAKNWFEEKTALVAAFFLSLAFLHVRDSHFGITDITMTLFVMCSFLFITKCRQNTGIKNYVLAGIFAGLAASTKYVGIILLGPMVLVHFFNIQDERPVRWRNIIDKRTVSFCACMIIAFLAGTPFALLDYPAFLGGLMYDVNHLKEGGVECLVVLERGWLRHPKYTLPYGLGWSLFWASLGGIAVAMKLDARKALVLCAFPLLYFIPAGRGLYVTVRYMIPLIPFFCLAGAFFVVTVCDVLSRNKSPRLKNCIIVIAAALVISPSLYSVVQFDNLISQKDNRLIATEWVNKNIPEGSSIYQRGMPPLELPRLLKDMEKEYNQKITRGINDRCLKIKLADMRSRKVTGYENWEPSIDGKQILYNNVVQKTLPDYMIIGLSPLVYHSILPDDIQQALKESYRLIKTFIAVDMSRSDCWYDLQDAFYVPFNGFQGVARPGPNLYIYQKKSRGSG